MPVEELLRQRLKENSPWPFLFLGSGFSRRYIGLANWEELLRRFCVNIKEFEYYLSSSDSDLPLTASKMADDYKDFWWTSAATAEERSKFKATAKYLSSPLKISIAEYVKSISSRKFTEDTCSHEEISELKKSNVDGIITTNWDLVSESLFPDYKVFIGQEELLVSTPQNIGEIYKIHGCCTKPNSLVLTQEDYKRFEASNPYLAAKLVTIFVENPVIFMGYSLNDPNIRNLLSSVVRGIGARNISKITKNLIFVQRVRDGRPYGARETIYALGSTEIPVTLLVTDDFSEIYKALQSVEHKIPARILRYCKEQIYELVRETTPSEKLCVVDFEELDDSSNIEFVVGVGILDRLSDKGYQPIVLEDIFRDIIFNNGRYNARTLLSSTVQAYFKHTKYVPVFKYLKEIGVSSHAAYNNVSIPLRCIDEFNINDFRNSQYSRFFVRECKGMNVQEIVSNYDSDKAAFLLPFIPWKALNCNILKEFIIQNIEKINGKISTYSTYYRKLICIYDIITNGWQES